MDVQTANCSLLDLHEEKHPEKILCSRKWSGLCWDQESYPLILTLVPYTGNHAANYASQVIHP